MKPKETPSVYEQQVLPFGTTCSPCCAVYAVQKHVQDNHEGNEDVVKTVLESFNVDSCLRSLPISNEAQEQGSAIHWWI